MDYAKNLDPKTFNNTHDYILELVRRGLQAGYDLEDVAEHYKELIQNEATAIMKSTERNELQKQIQKDLDNLAVIDRNNTIVFPLELAGRTYKTSERDQYFEEILQRRLERRHKVNKLRESVFSDITWTTLPNMSKPFWTTTRKKKKPLPANSNKQPSSSYTVRVIAINNVSLATMYEHILDLHDHVTIVPLEVVDLTLEARMDSSVDSLAVNL